MARLLDVGLDMINNPLDERVAQPFLDRAIAPGIGHLLRSALLLDILGKLDQPLGGVRAVVQQNILDTLEQVGRDFLVHLEHAGIDNSHVQPSTDRVVQKRRMHRLAHSVVATKRK